MESIVVNSLDDIPAAAKKLIDFSCGQKIFLFYGEMGAGKTTLIKAICANLHVEETITSPTFSIVNEYQSPQGPIYHFDFYRLKNEIEALDLGYEDYFYSGNYCFVEWPEKIPGLLPHHYMKISIRADDDQHRFVKAEHI